MSGHRVTRQRFGSVGSLSGSAARAVGIDESRGAERAPAAARMVMAAVSLPTQRTSPEVPAASLATTTVLVADPGRPRRTTLAAGLLAMGIGRVLQAGSVADMDELLAHRHGGDVALVSLAFHLDRERLIPHLLEVGWLRVIVLAGTADPGPILTAVRAGATGVLRARPGVDHPDTLNHLSTREIQVIQLVADGRSTTLIAQERAQSALTVKSHLARIGRKLGTGDRAAMIAIAMRAGVIT
jgi:DNA-binding NarL/FixJ family response regulator